MKYGKVDDFCMLIVTKQNTVKPVLRGHLWNKEKWPYKISDLLKAGMDI
jgi:hypothetical protein